MTLFYVRDRQPYNVARPVTPSDTVDLPDGPCDAFWASPTGTVAVVGTDGSVTSFTVTNGSLVIPNLKAKRINATGTTSTGIVALYYK